jgi:DNA modification methylase
VKPPMPRFIHGDARHLPLPDETVDLVVTSPPYFGLRDYGSDQQIGAEPTPQEFIAALIECTRELTRVLKPGGSIFVNLGDKYSGAQAQNFGGKSRTDSAKVWTQTNPKNTGIPNKSLMLLPERYRIAAVDQLGLIARAVIIWDKPNGLPESVTDRVRRSHEDWVHLTKSPKYFASVDEIREPHLHPGLGMAPEARRAEGRRGDRATRGAREADRVQGDNSKAGNPLGKLPGSVWEIPTQPLKVPAHLGVDHYAAYPMEWPRRIIQGWSPKEVCTVCGEGRRPVTAARRTRNGEHVTGALFGKGGRFDTATGRRHTEVTERELVGYACGCADTSAPSTPGVVLDPFSGTGTTTLVAAMLGRHGIGIELNPDYIRLAQWRAQDAKERARAAGWDRDAVAAVKTELPGQESLLDLLDGEPA